MRLENKVTRDTTTCGDCDFQHEANEANPAALRHIDNNPTHRLVVVSTTARWFTGSDQAVAV